MKQLGEIKRLSKEKGNMKYLKVGKVRGRYDL